MVQSRSSQLRAQVACETPDEICLIFYDLRTAGTFRVVLRAAGIEEPMHIVSGSADVLIAAVRRDGTPILLQYRLPREALARR
jgi:hypothetical protein